MLCECKTFFCCIASTAFAAACLVAHGATSSLDDALALCRRTYEYVAKSIPANEAKRFAQPFDALVNRGDETKSRVLWLCNAKDRDALLALCRKSLKPHPAQDVQGTCGRDGACECNSCWVRRGGYNIPKRK